MSDSQARDELFYNKVSRAMPEAIEEVVDFRGERTLVIKQNLLKEVCLLLRDDQETQCNFL